MCCPLPRAHIVGPLACFATLLAGAPSVHAQKPTTISKPASLYAPDSVWNQRIPNNPPIDPGSERMISGLVNSVASHGFVMNLNEWSIPVYQATPETIPISVALSADWSPHTSMEAVPIPSFAEPDPLNDGHMVILSADQQCHFDLWQARQVGNRWVASWANALSLDGSGIYEQGLGARAAGFGLLAGLIWPEELQQGRINHALVFATGATRDGGPVFPATASDGVTAGLEAIPIGAHLQLDPNFDIATLEPPYLRTIARALQEYGMICGDTTGGSVDLYALNPISAEPNPYAGILPDPRAPFPSIAGIPAKSFRVLRMPPPDTDSRSAVVETGCNQFSGEWMNGVRDLAVREPFLFVADGISGVRIFDVSNPATPKSVATLETEEPATSITVQGSLIFVGTAGAGVAIINTESPTEPAEISRIGVEDALSIASLAVHNNQLFILGDDPPLLMSVDISEPENPRVKAEIDDINIFDTPRDLAIAPPYLYATDQVTQLQVIDISEPGTLQVVTEESDEEFFPNAVSIREQRAFVTDEDNGLLSFDLTNPTSPRLIARLKLPDFAFGITLQGPSAYIANGGGGLQVVDISDPAMPRLQQTAQPQIGYARSVASINNQLYLGSIGGGVLIFEDPAQGPLAQLGAIENPLGSIITPSTPPSPSQPAEENGLRIDRISYRPSIGFSFLIEGLPNQMVAIEISEDLEEWELLDQILLTEENREFVDDEAVGEAITFYRLRVVSQAP